MAHEIRIEERRLHVYFRSTGEGGVAEFGDDEREVARDTLVVEALQCFREPFRSRRELRWRRRADVIERIPLEGEEAEVGEAIARREDGEKARHPRCAGGVFGPRHHRGALRTLKARAADGGPGHDTAQRV